MESGGKLAIEREEADVESDRFWEKAEDELDPDDIVDDMGEEATC